MKKKYTKKQICEAIAYWEKILEDMNNATSEETVKIPGTSQEEEEQFIKWADQQFDGDMYNKLVSNEQEEIEGTQRDLDDFDVYRYSEQDTIDEDDFWEAIFEKMHEDFNTNETVQKKQMITWLQSAADDIVTQAFDDFEPGREYLIHAGHYKSEEYWRS